MSVQDIFLQKKDWNFSIWQTDRFKYYRIYAKQTLASLLSLAGRDSTGMCYLFRGQAACCLNSPLHPRRTSVLSSATRLASAILHKSYIQ
jgi:hypothetical protein